jgi:cell division protein FtsL
VEKNDYIKKILEEDLQMNQYLLNVKDKIQKTEEQIEKVEMTIDQSKENWDKDMQAINNRIFDIANQNGITKEQYYQNY